MAERTTAGQVAAGDGDGRVDPPEAQRAVGRTGGEQTVLRVQRGVAVDERAAGDGGRVAHVLVHQFAHPYVPQLLGAFTALLTGHNDYMGRGAVHNEERVGVRTAAVQPSPRQP